ncbi:MAG: acetyl/propionyl/methylcrotonyl-CoA carboxylase subunit alpha [Planctomycetota bacterium]
MKLPERVLVANRGEIAVRVLSTCRQLGIHGIWARVESDTPAPAETVADQVVMLEKPSDYLDIPTMLKIAKDVRADAIHPGYGYLSENPRFAAALDGAGIRFVGAPAKAMEAMGDKIRSRELMEKAGVPVVPGTRDLSDPSAALRATGLPCLIKASAGGGGKGMQIVREEGDFLAALDSCRRTARAAFGDDRVYLERYVEQARHVEVQVMASQDEVRTYGTRDCSVQRRHQKVVEECPAPGLSSALDERIQHTAAEAARAVDYRGAGTVEFLLAPDGAFYFLEMNTRLQVEHGVTELVWGRDLVAEQLQVAAGGSLPAPSAPRGHAIEVRLCAEDPATGLPCNGRIHLLRWPSGPGIRVDAGVVTGSRVGLDFDSLLAKIMAWGPDRREAAMRLSSALRDLVLHGVGHNAGRLLDILAHPDFLAGSIHTGWLETQGLGTFAPGRAHAAALALASSATAAAPAGTAGRQILPKPYLATPPFRLLP